MNIEELLKEPSGNGSEKGKSSSPLESLKIDLDFYSDAIKEVSADLIAEQYSTHPIFIAHQHSVKIGEVILDKMELNTSWSINVSTLEEFVEKGIIKEDRKDYFIKQYKPAAQFMCLFVVVPEGANFVFYPYK
ncbi:MULTISPECIES: hypothetical protein [Sphingobacterium]|uniref:Uncharacterized protein n=1 Tax=Sphingobacterium populi TaxID=1812824 RepID=A0ABW5UE90_9SPHI|nr:hypothetical protein [Sphingobacterium sp. CFCC 11742]